MTAAKVETGRVEPAHCLHGIADMVMMMLRRERLLLAVHSETPPTSAEWQRWMNLSAERVGADLRAMVEVYGSAGPNARQRNALTSLLGRVDVRTAVLTESLMARGLVTAVSWLGLPIHAFGIGQHEPAAHYLDLTAEELSFAAAQLPTLRQAAGVCASPRTQSRRPRAGI